MPDDADPIAQRLDPERSWIAVGPENRRGARQVVDTAFGDLQIEDRLTGTERDVPERPAELAVEREGDVLGDLDRAVGSDDDLNTSFGQVVILGPRRSGDGSDEEPDEDRERAETFQKSTLGGSR